MADVRGIKDLEEFLNPTNKYIHSPYLLNNIEVVAKRIIEAMENNEKICISYDCDADGICAGTLMYRYLNYFTNNLSYIYNQREAGHGISVQDVPLDIDLLIVVDSSTNETDECQRLLEHKIDVLILDHHPQIRFNPYATIVNPQMDNYPNKDLSGVGVVFKLCNVLDDMLNVEYSQLYYDLVGVGLYADVMSVMEYENRYLISMGLKNINNLGLKAILQQSKVNEINSQTIGYKISPIINATARMGNIETIIELFLESDWQKCLNLAKECIALNENRKKIQAKIFNKVKNRIDLSNKLIIVETTGEDRIGKGFNGLLATDIANYYQKPTLVVRNENGICAGSGRSVGGILLREVLKETGLFIKAEGHSGAMGIVFDSKNIDKIHKYLNETLQDVEDEVKINYDLEIDKSKINFDLVKEIEEFNYITGKDCEPVKFIIKDLKVKDKKILGKMLDTVKITTEELDLMKFKVNEFYGNDIKIGDKIDIIGSLGINKYYNFPQKRWIITLQSFIDDYKINK